ncbi:MAG: hypothetical protein ACLGQH_03855 [Acidobacteriota bacterium]
MDAIGGSTSGAATSALKQQTMGAQVITETLNRLNTNDNGQVNADYDFQTKVLAGLGKGTQVDVGV